LRAIGKSPVPAEQLRPAKVEISRITVSPDRGEISTYPASSASENEKPRPHTGLAAMIPSDNQGGDASLAVRASFR
jgi:hypothetical protein